MIDQQTTKSVVLMIAATLLMGSASAKADFAFSHNGNEYQVITSAKPWDSAVADARTKLVDGASCYLARIDDSAENNAIFSQLSSNIPASDFSSTVAPDGGGGAYVWLGGNDISSEGDWKWEDNGAQFWQGDVTGGPVGGLYNNWGDEPDNFGGAQNALGISLNGWPLGDAGEWNDVDQNNSLYYIIECDGVTPEPPVPPVPPVPPEPPVPPVPTVATPVPTSPIWLLGMMAGLLSLVAVRKLRKT